MYTPSCYMRCLYRVSQMTKDYTSTYSSLISMNEWFLPCNKKPCNHYWTRKRNSHLALVDLIFDLNENCSMISGRSRRKKAQIFHLFFLPSALSSRISGIWHKMSGFAVKWKIEKSNTTKEKAAWEGWNYYVNAPLNWRKIGASLGFE